MQDFYTASAFLRRDVKNKKISGQFIDFIIFLLLLSALACGIFFGKAVLYGKAAEGRALRIETESLPDIHSGKLAEGDSVYDTLSKKKRGEIRDLSEHRRLDKIYYRFTLDSSAEPRGKALRTERLWFYFKEISE